MTDDPITILATHLRAGEAPPISWAVEWLDSDGKFPRAWAVTKDLSAMRFVLGSPLAGVRANGQPTPLTVLRGVASVFLSNEDLLQFVSGFLIGGAARVIGIQRIGFPRLAMWMGKSSQFVRRVSRRKRLEIAERIREQILRRQIETPSLPELLRRLKIGAHGGGA